MCPVTQLPGATRQAGCRYELLTHTRIFPRLQDRRAIVDCLTGRALLPWEDLARSSELEQMKGLKRSVLACLSRDPGKRPTTELLLRRCAADQTVHTSSDAALAAINHTLWRLMSMLLGMQEACCTRCSAQGLCSAGALWCVALWCVVC